MRIPRFAVARTLAIALLLLAPLAACADEVAGPPPVPDGIAGFYRLVSVDGLALPADIGFSLGVPRRTELVRGEIQIFEDARFVDAAVFRLWHPDDVAYDEWVSSDQGAVYVSADAQVLQLRPGNSPALTLSRDGTDLLQEWNGYELRYARQNILVANGQGSESP
jgi:hypothetical protein